jgi:hypothetical protein
VGWRLPREHHRGLAANDGGVSSDSAPSDSAFGRMKCAVGRPSHNGEKGLRK